MRHESVMAAEAIRGLSLQPGYRVCDATGGMGGHSRLIAAQVGPEGRVYCCDTDAESLEMARAQTAEPELSRIEFIHTPFSGLPGVLGERNALRVDGLLADFGTSMMHFQTAERGFSLMHDGPLDMRLNRSSDGPTAADLVNRLSERELADLIYTTGERRSRPIARALVRARPVVTTRQFADVIAAAVPRTSKLHPATLSALSLRIAVNQEYGEIEALIGALPELVRPGGRVVFITFHSGEDLIAKTGTRRLAKEGRAVLINKHVLTPTDEEVRRNPASRSAKMRVLEMR